MRELPDRRKVESAATFALDSVEALGSYRADVYYVARWSSYVSLREGVPEEDKTEAFWRIGLRVIDPHGHQGVSDTDDLSLNGIKKMVEWSIANCKSSQPDENVMLYGEKNEPMDLNLFDPEVLKLSHEDKVNLCMEMHEIAASQKKVKSVRGSSFGNGMSEVFYCSTEGLSFWESETEASCGVAVVMESGDQMDMGGFGEVACSMEGIDPQKTALEAVKRTAIALGGAPAPTGRYTLVLDPEVAATMVDVIGELFLSSNVHKNRSMLKGKLGQRVGSEAVTLVDDGRLSGRLGSACFDAEGVPTQRTVIMESGVAKSFLYDLKNAKIAGASPTGNAVRSTGSLPDVGFTNLYISPGRGTLEEFLNTPGTKIYVTDLMGVHTIDPVSGEFSLGAKGALCESVSDLRPVSGISIAGNLIDLMMKVSKVGEDLRFFGSTGGCSMVIEDVQVAGN